MDSRIQINEYDYSASALPTTSRSIGCTVVHAPKGPKKPVLISAGDKNALKDIFGSFSQCTTKEQKQDMFELETFVSSYSCYVSAPYTVGSSTPIPAVKIAADGSMTVSSITWQENFEDDDWLLSEDITDDTAVAYIIPVSPRASGKMYVTATKVPGSADTDLRSTFEVYEDDAYHGESKPYKIELDVSSESTKNANNSIVGLSRGNSPYIGNKLFRVVRGKATLTAAPHCSKLTINHTGRIDATDYEAGWDLIGKDPDIAKAVDVFFNVEHLTTDFTGRFFTLASGDTDETDPVDFQQSCYIFNATPDPDAATTLSIAGEQGKRYYNLYNEGYVTYQNVTLCSNGVGARAVMQCRINENKLGGWAPMYLNVGGMGGQLGLNFSKMRYKLTKKQISELSDKLYNPMIKDPTYGVMVVNQRTCQSGEVTDWSYIGHSAAFIEFEKDVRRYVMEPQIGKPNNPYYRELRATQVQRMLDLRCNGDDRIWAAAVVDTSTRDGVNDAENRAARKFVINVKVKVDVFSEFVVLNFTNVGQDVDVTE